jgi:hypothetical protein
VFELAMLARRAASHSIAKLGSITFPQGPNGGGKVRLALPAGSKDIRRAVIRSLIEVCISNFS